LGIISAELEIPVAMSAEAADRLYDSTEQQVIFIYWALGWELTALKALSTLQTLFW
jgi:hypothetical protein